MQRIGPLSDLSNPDSLNKPKHLATKYKTYVYLFDMYSEKVLYI